MKLSKTEVQTIQSFYGKLTSGELGNILNKTPDSIRYHIKQMQKAKQLPFLRECKGKQKLENKTESIPTTLTKLCTCCNKEKPLTAFNRASKSPDGRQNPCKACRKSKRDGKPISPVLPIQKTSIVSQPKIILTKDPHPQTIVVPAPVVTPPALETRGTLKYIPERTTLRVAKKALAKILMNHTIPDKDIEELKNSCEDAELKSFLSTIQIIR